MTFRQVDPLYTIDLADPTAPKVLGQLELLGYSAYLHPIADGLLLGVGQDATPEGRTKGVQVSLFGVGDPAASEAAGPARARRGVVVAGRVRQPRLPLLGPAPARRAAGPGLRRRAGTPSSPGFTGAVALTVTPRASPRPAGSPTTRPTATSRRSRRSVVIGDQLLTVSDGGVLASALDGFARVGWVAFPAPPVSSSPGRLGLRRAELCRAARCRLMPHRGDGVSGGRHALASVPVAWPTFDVAITWYRTRAIAPSTRLRTTARARNAARLPSPSVML